MDDLKDWTTVSFDGLLFGLIDISFTHLAEARTVLKDWRDSNVRRSEESVELWEHVLSRRPASLDDELWVVYEQIGIAALDCARLDVAELCVNELVKKFGRQSTRVMRLQAMQLECVRRFDEALKIYRRLIDDDATNTVGTPS